MLKITFLPCKIMANNHNVDNYSVNYVIKKIKTLKANLLTAQLSDLVNHIF